ncbi:MAG: RDD family protein [Candidatus Bathyarchaeia archaeon]
MTQQEYKGIGVRFGAQVIDGIILAIIYFIIGFAAFGTWSWQATGGAAAPIILVNGVVSLLYFTLLEGAVGATLGKKALKLKVLREDGAPCSLGAAFIRNILRIVDALPFIYILGMILIAKSPKKQRLGDRIARTVVVGATGLSASRAPTPIAAPEAPTEEVGFCINCGARIPKSAIYCPKCGAKQ